MNCIMAQDETDVQHEPQGIPVDSRNWTQDKTSRMSFKHLILSMNYSCRFKCLWKLIRKWWMKMKGNTDQIYKGHKGHRGQLPGPHCSRGPLCPLNATVEQALYKLLQLNWGGGECSVTLLSSVTPFFYFVLPYSRFFQNFSFFFFEGAPWSRESP